MSSVGGRYVRPSLAHDECERFHLHAVCDPRPIAVDAKGALVGSSRLQSTSYAPLAGTTLSGQKPWQAPQCRGACRASQAAPLAHGQELMPLSDFTSANKEQRTTEHVLPRHPKDGDACWWDHFTEEQHAALVDSLGNLVLTYDNSSYGRKCFEGKRGQPLAPHMAVPSPCYAQAPLQQERRLAYYASWTPDVIAERQRALADWALERWAIQPPSTTRIVDDVVDIEPEEEANLDESLGPDALSTSTPVS